jgi:hypothetical protein
LISAWHPYIYFYGALISAYSPYVCFYSALISAWGPYVLFYGALISAWDLYVCYYGALISAWGFYALQVFDERMTVSEFIQISKVIRLRRSYTLSGTLPLMLLNITMERIKLFNLPISLGMVP